MKIVPVNNSPAVEPALRKFVNQRAGFFAQEEWLGLYPQNNLQRCAILNNNDEVIGCFIYYTFKKAIFNCAITPPFSPHISLYYKNPAESVVGKNSFTKEVMETLASFLKKQNLDLIDFALPAAEVDTQPFTWAGFSTQWRYSYWIDLLKSRDELWERLSSEKRKSINKADKDGLKISESKDFTQVRTIVESTLERNAVFKNQDLIKKIIDQNMQDKVYACLAFQDQLPVGTAFYVKDGDTAVYLFGGTSNDNRNHGAGAACMWNCILHAKAQGLTKFDFEGSMHPGIERYFREFGGDLVPYAAITLRKPLISFLMKVLGK